MSCLPPHCICVHDRDPSLAVVGVTRVCFLHCLLFNGKQVANVCPESRKSHSNGVTLPMRGLVFVVLVEIRLSKFAWIHLKREDLGFVGSWDLKI